MRLRTLPVFLAFLAMGFADAVGPFVSLAKNEFHLSNAVASLIPFVGFVMFGLLSIPMGIFQDRRGKKFVLMLGLVVALIGLLNAAFGLTSFARFLLTVLLVGAGAAILQVSGNPIMRDVSDPGKYARNLSLAQFVKAIGSLSGPMIPVLAAKYFGASWSVIFPIYAVALVVAVVAVAGLRVEEKKNEHHAATLRSCLALLANGYVLMMVAAIFFYVGAEVSVSAGIPLYLKERFDIDINKVGLLGTGLFFTALTIGRFSGGVILNWIAPRKFFLITCGVSVVALLCLFVPDRTLAVVSFFVVGFGFANIFPLVFAIAVEAMPEHTNELSGLMVTAILGGGVSAASDGPGGRSQFRAIQFPGAAGRDSLRHLDRGLQSRGAVAGITTMQQYNHDQRIVMTLDAGGTNFVFSAMQANRPVVESFALPSNADRPGALARQHRGGLPESAGAIARARRRRSVSRFRRRRITSTASLSARAICRPTATWRWDPCSKIGLACPPSSTTMATCSLTARRWPDSCLTSTDCSNRRAARSAIATCSGVTLGTGFGGGIVRDGALFIGDNSMAGEIWLARHKLEHDTNAEEGASIRAVRRVYAARAGLRAGRHAGAEGDLRDRRRDGRPAIARRRGKPSAAWGKWRATLSRRPSRCSTDWW